MPTDNQQKNPLPKIVQDLNQQKSNEQQIVEELQNTRKSIAGAFGSLKSLFSPEKTERLLQRALSNTNEAIKSALNDVSSVITSQIAQSPLLAGAFNAVKGLTTDFIGMFKNKDELTGDEKEKLADERADKQVEATEQVGEKVEMLADYMKPNEELRREQNVKDKRVIDTLAEIRDALSQKQQLAKTEQDGGMFDSSALSTGLGVFSGNLALKALSGMKMGLSSFVGMLFKGLAKAIPIAAVVGTLFSGLSDAIRKYQETGNLSEAFESFGVGVLEFLTFGLVNQDNIEKIQDWTSRKIIEPVMNFIGNIGEILSAGWGNMIDKFKEVFPKLTAWVNDKFGNFFEWVARKWEPFQNLYESAVDFTSLGIEKFANWLENLRNGFEQLANFGLDFIGDTLKKISMFYANLFDQIIVGSLSLLPDFIKNRFESLKTIENDAKQRIEQRLMLQQENISQKQNRPENLDRQTNEIQRMKEEKQREATAAILQNSTVVNNQSQKVNIFSPLNSGALNRPVTVTP